jgi:hypothetical protein
VWADRNGDHFMDEGEGLAGIRLTLRCSPAEEQQATTNEAGYYRLAPVEAGTCTIEITDPNGHWPPMIASFIAIGEPFLRLDFTYSMISLPLVVKAR